MVNPLISCFDWFIQFLQIIPTPCLSFLYLALALFFTGAVLRWFL